MTYKYVITADGKAKVFDTSRIHAFQVCGCSFKDCEGRAVSAGFVEVSEDVTMKTTGQSTSLGVRSRPEDVEIVRSLVPLTSTSMN